MDETLRRGVIRNELGSSALAGRSFESARRTFAAYKVEALCAGILVAMSLVLVATTARKSITCDEIVLIPAAYYHLVTNDVQLIPQHPPLCKWLAGLPLLFLQPAERPAGPDDSSLKRDDREWDYTMRFWRDNRARFDSISFWARLPMIALTLGVGGLTFLFARDLFGRRAGLLAVLLFALEPTILAHGRVVQTDMAAAFGFLLTVFAFYRYFGAPHWKRACGVGAAAGVAMLAKYSMVVLGPLLVLAFAALFWRWRTQRKAVSLHALFAALTLIVVINAGYFFYHRSLTEADFTWVTAVFHSQTLVWNSIRVLRLLLPTDFVMGVYWQINHSHEGHPAGLLGMYAQRGWWYYFPVAFAFKTTLPFLILSICSLGWALGRVIRRSEWRLLFLFLPFCLYTALMMATPINIGVRYYLPGYLFLIILGAAFLDALLRRSAAGRKAVFMTAATIMLVAAMAFEICRTYPNYMPYLNQLAFAKPHWWYLSDSNVEWGDDVKELATYLQARGEDRVRAMLLGGFITLDYYGIDYVDALSPVSDPMPRYTAIGASFLNGSTVPFYRIDGREVSDEVRQNTFAAYRNRVPEAIIGNSIYLFRTRD